MRFVDVPHLPSSPCRCAVAGGLCDLAVKELQRFGVAVLAPEAEPGLPAQTNTHADMVFMYLGRGRAVVSAFQKKLTERFLSFGGRAVDTVMLGERYPDDVPLNALLLNECLFCNSRTVHPAIYDICKTENIKIFDLRQGYTKCSVCVVAKNAVITEDPGVFLAIGKTGECDVLKISPGAVALRGHDRGFIGGCTGKIANDILAFNGRFEDHPDRDDISAFCAHHGVSPISLGNWRLYDNGGIVPLLES